MSTVSTVLSSIKLFTMSQSLNTNSTPRATARKTQGKLFAPLFRPLPVLRRGVVLLFNAVAKAQKQQHEGGEAVSGKAAKLNKASFLAQLKAGGGAVAGQAGARAGAGAAAASKEAAASAPGWKVLQDSFTGLAGEGGKGGGPNP